MIFTQPLPALARIFILTSVYVALALTIILNITWIQSALDQLLDFGSFIAAGQEAASGHNPYTEDSLLVYLIESENNAQPLPSPNLNPPLSILFFIPLSKLDPITAVSGWRIATALLFGMGVLILANSYPTSTNLTRIAWALSLAGFWHMIALGQIYAPLLILAIGVWIFTERGDHKLAGLALGAIIAIKPNFVFWLVLLGVTGYTAAALTAAIVALALSILPALIFGVEVYKQWLTALFNYPSRGLSIAGNTSFQSLTARFGSALPGTLISLLFIAGSLYFAHQHKFSLNRINTLGLVGSLLISPFSWVGYTILTLPIFFARSRWSWPYKLSAALLSFPYILILYFFQKSFFNLVLFGWLYGWGLLFILAGLILDKDDKPKEPDVMNSTKTSSTQWKLSNSRK
jgi:Glycosyltransferase family 87